MSMDDDVADDESSSDGDDVSVSSVPIVPLFLPQPVPPFPANNASVHSAGSTTNDDDTATLSPTDIPLPIDDTPADVLLNPVAPDEDILVAAADTAAHDILVPDAVPRILLMLFLLMMLLMPLMMFLLMMLLMPLPM